VAFPPPFFQVKRSPRALTDRSPGGLDGNVMPFLEISRPRCFNPQSTFQLGFHPQRSVSPFFPTLDHPPVVSPKFVKGLKVAG